MILILLRISVFSGTGFILFSVTYVAAAKRELLGYIPFGWVFAGHMQLKVYGKKENPAYNQ